VRQILLKLLAPSAPPSEWQTATHLARPADWGTFCGILHRCGLAAYAYQRVSGAASTLPEPVAAWLRVQHEHAAERNLVLLRELHAVTAHLLKHGVPALVLKGPVLAHLGVGTLVRTYHDLDVLVPRPEFPRAVEALRTLGFVEHPEAHGFHQAMVRVRPAPAPPAAVEVHFDLADYGHPYAPDVLGVWDRAIDVEIRGLVVRAPELTDHLLLTIMQLPHHHFGPRLMLDIACIVHAHGAEVNWEHLIERANAWEMRALVGSALYVLGSLLQVPLPARVSAFAEPAGYVRGVQWRIARRAFLDHLSRSPGGKTADVAPFVMVDRVRSMGYLLRQRVLREWGQEAGGVSVLSR
jgi:hypothetical protein